MIYATAGVTCSMSFAVARSIVRACRSYFGGELVPRLHPMLDRFYSDDRPGPSTMGVRIEKVRVRFFQVFSSCWRRLRPAADRTAGRQTAERAQNLQGYLSIFPAVPTAGTTFL